MTRKLETLLLKREEIVLRPYERSCSLMVPVYHGLVSPEVELDPNLAKKVFPEAARQWHQDLTAYVKFLETANGDYLDRSKKDWFKEAFLSLGSEVKQRRGVQYLGEHQFWVDQVDNLDNGFAGGLRINRNAGGSLFFHEDSEPEYLLPSLVQFSPDKLKAYHVRNHRGRDYSGLESRDQPRFVSFVYETHNIDHYPGALFLRNWAVLYLNAALTELAKKKQESEMYSASSKII